MTPNSEKLKLSCWIGTDEAGKGDYLGPLSVAAVCLTEADRALAMEVGVKDSKKIADSKILEISKEIHNRWPSAVVTVGPVRYNELLPKMKNLNFLLAWAHVKAVLEILKNPAIKADLWVADKFGKDSYLRDAARAQQLKVELAQRVRAEDDLAVAAASILARADFLTKIEALEKKYDVPLHKGAGTPTDNDAKAFVAKYGPEKLGQVAKLHFKNTKKLGLLQ